MDDMQVFIQLSRNKTLFSIIFFISLLYINKAHTHTPYKFLVIKWRKIVIQYFTFSVGRSFLKALLFQISSGSAQLPLLVHLLHMAVILALLSCEGFDAEEFSEDALDDLEELDASAVHVANLLSTEPADIKLGIGGFSMGGATALYCAMCHCLRHCVNGYLYQIKIHCIVALSGWLPCSRMLRSCIERSSEAMKRASSLPTMICHGTGDDQVAYTLGEKSAQTIKASGFQNLVFRTYEELGHYHSPEEVHELCCWLNATLELDGSYN